MLFWLYLTVISNDISNLYGRNPKGLLPTSPLFHTFCEASQVSPLIKQSAGNTPVVLI
jgi:hypothetical protein